MHKIIIVISFLLCIALVPASFALDEQGRNAGQSAGNFGLSIIGNSSGLDARSKMPLTDQNTQLRTFDGTQQRTAAVLCGQGTVQELNKAISVNVMSYSIYVSSDSNNDGYLDASGSFYVSKVCHSGFQYGGGYYSWVVDANGIVSSVSSAVPLDGCIDPSAAPPSYTGGKIAELYSRMTGRQITKSETVDTTVNYYAGSVKDCNNSPKDISQTKYYSNPYSMEGDGVAQLTTGCPAGDTYCQAYKSAPASVSSAQSNVSGPGQGTTTCPITRTIIDAKGPHNGVICEAGKLYYGLGYDETAKYCMSTQSKWDYNSMFRVRCNQYGTEMKLEGWAFWEGAPCGNGIQANYPPDNQVSYQLTYGGNITDLIIGQLSVNRRSGGDNISPNDLQANATECYSTASPLRVHMWQSCPVTNEYCQYSLAVENAPSCGSFSINVVPPPGEDISNSCAIYEQQIGCKLKDESWYDAQDNPIITMSNGSPTHNPTPETCRTFAIAGTVCKEWWRKSRGYQCVASNTVFSPDTSRAMSAAMSADNGGGSSVHFTRSTLNKENTGNCLIEVTSSSTSLSASDCSAYGGSMQSGSCITKGYLSSACIYQDASTKTGLYCDTVSVASFVFPDEVSRRVSRDCIEQSQCNVSCVVGMPGNATQTISCINNGNNTYSCPSDGNPIIKDCDCSIETWDRALTQGESCEVACLVDEYGSETSSNVTRDYRLLTCNKTYVSGSPQYTCPLSGGQQLRQDCACVDTFGLSAGVLGALSQALKDRECQ